MNIDYLRLLFDYHYWAINHLVNFLLKLSSEQVTMVSPHFYHETAYKTVLHTLDVDWSWLQGCMGLSGTQYLWEVEDLPDMKSLQSFLTNEKERVENYLNGLSETDLTTKVEYGEKQDGLELWHILVHIINHGTEHRTEIGHYLTECGASPGELNLMYYLTSVRNR